MKVLVLTVSAITWLATPAIADWSDGGTLHRANFAEWSASSQTNRLATSSDWVIQLISTAKNEPISMDVLKINSAKLASCITQAGTRNEQGMPASHVVVDCASGLTW